MRSCKVAEAINTGVIINHQSSKSKIQKQKYTHCKLHTHSLTAQSTRSHTHSIMCERVFREKASGRWLGAALINSKQQTLGKRRAAAKERKVMKANIFCMVCIQCSMIETGQLGGGRT